MGTCLQNGSFSYFELGNVPRCQPKMGAGGEVWPQLWLKGLCPQSKLQQRGSIQEELDMLPSHLAVFQNTRQANLGEHSLTLEEEASVGRSMQNVIVAAYLSSEKSNEELLPGCVWPRLTQPSTIFQVQTSSNKSSTRSVSIFSEARPSLVLTR